MCRRGFGAASTATRTGIYLECFMDELAHAAGQDPLAFRRKLMANHPRHLAVLDAVAERVGWNKPAPQGVFRGIAQQMGLGSYVAAAAEISVTEGNKIKVHRIVAATDPGTVVNPAQVERQVAGSFVFGLVGVVLWPVHGEGRTDRADQLRHLQLDAHPRDAEGGSDRDAERRFRGGVGEPTITVAAPAVLNAYFAATGKRIRSVPLSKFDIVFA